jgi:hypothetical protein
MREFRRTCLATLLVLLVGASVEAQVPYGNGSPGTGGLIPHLTSNQAYMGNANFSFSVSNGLGGASALFVLSLGKSSTFVGTTEILVNLGALVLLLPLGLTGPNGTPGAGSANVPLPLNFPPTPSAAGALFYAQVVVIDFPTPGSPAASRGLEVELTYPPLVFVGTSVGGSTDPFYLVDPLVPSLVYSSNNAFTDNVTDAVWNRGGAELFIGSSIRNQVNVADMTAIPPVWTTIYTSAGSGCYGMGIDRTFKRLYTFTNPGTATREITALDIQPGSPTYGQRLANTVGVASGGLAERWNISPSGKKICLLTLLPGNMIVIDSDVNSAGYLTFGPQIIIPTSPGPLALANQVRITPDDAYALVVIQNAGTQPGDLARYDFNAQAWVDHNTSMPGIQNIGALSSPAVNFGSAFTGISLSKDGSFALVSGFGGTGWAGRLDFQGASWNYTAFNPGVPLAGSWAIGLTDGEARAAIGTFPSPSACVVTDSLNGTLVGSVPLPGAGNVYTVMSR